MKVWFYPSAYIWELIEVAHLLIWVVLPVFPIVKVDTEPTQLWKQSQHFFFKLRLLLKSEYFSDVLTCGRPSPSLSLASATPSLAALFVDSTTLSGLCVCVWIPGSRFKQSTETNAVTPALCAVNKCSIAFLKAISTTYIFINGIEKVYFILMLHIVSSSKTAAGNKDTYSL